MKKNYYTAILFAGRPDLHMTLTYYKNLSPEQLAKLVEKVDAVAKNSPLRQFRLRADMEAWFGPQHTVRVLQPRFSQMRWPNWVRGLCRSVESLHVTCKDESLDLTATALVVMTKKVEVTRWELK